MGDGVRMTMAIVLHKIRKPGNKLLESYIESYVERATAKTTARAVVRAVMRAMVRDTAMREEYSSAL